MSRNALFTSGAESPVATRNTFRIMNLGPFFVWFTFAPNSKAVSLPQFQARGVTIDSGYGRKAREIKTWCR